MKKVFKLPLKINNLLLVLLYFIPIAQEDSLTKLEDKSHGVTYQVRFCYDTTHILTITFSE